MFNAYPLLDCQFCFPAESFEIKEVKYECNIAVVRKSRVTNQLLTPTRWIAEPFCELLVPR